MADNKTLQPIKLWGRIGPNPPKVSILLEELSLPYEIVDVAWSEVKSPAYVAVNPNGRLPAIHDPNTNLTLWESGAIIEYLIERYDTQHTLSFAPGSNESHLAKQWLFFQTTGQGPYYGQAVWFKRGDPENKVAIERYINEIHRVSGVVEGHLVAQGKEGGEGSDGPWLVGGRISYADLAWLPWQRVISKFLSTEEYDVAKYPAMAAWLAKIQEREAVKKVLATLG
ncbi:glutathione S-transferase [Podospora appendiculata]|uniref:Glutathione S-transferase n=1 Tax=Podospora appendiculata TaxID=314037 RepID=A0AAE0X1W0_9PEZI|nr:glutathione S-transferase [Podospora appendiculata]